VREIETIYLESGKQVYGFVFSIDHGLGVSYNGISIECIVNTPKPKNKHGKVCYITSSVKITPWENKKGDLSGEDIREIVSYVIKKWTDFKNNL